VNGPPDLLPAAFHWLEYLGLLGALGAFAVRRLGRQSPQLKWAEPPMHIALAVALVGGLGLLASGPSLQIGARVVAEVMALVLCLRGIPVVIVPLLTSALLAGSDLAAAVHIVSAGLWAGGILALASLHPPGGWGSPDARSLVERFGRVAVVAFGVTALTGLVRATEQLHGLADLWTTTYGVVLAVKCVLVVAMLAVSPAWRRGWTAARLDAFLAVAVIGATSLLAAFPLTVN
jgi:putative copper export protein